MLQVFRDAKRVMTTEQFHNEIIGGIAFLILFPILFAGIWIITPA
jgi:hypothetical protein